MPTKNYYLFRIPHHYRLKQIKKNQKQTMDKVQFLQGVKADNPESINEYAQLVAKKYKEYINEYINWLEDREHSIELLDIFIFLYGQEDYSIPMHLEENSDNDHYSMDEEEMDKHIVEYEKVYKLIMPSNGYLPPDVLIFPWIDVLFIIRKTDNVFLTIVSFGADGLKKLENTRRREMITGTIKLLRYSDRSITVANENGEEWVVYFHPRTFKVVCITTIANNVNLRKQYDFKPMKSLKINDNDHVKFNITNRCIQLFRNNFIIDENFFIEDYIQIGYIQKFRNNSLAVLYTLLDQQVGARVIKLAIFGLNKVAPTNIFSKYKPKIQRRRPVPILPDENKENEEP